VISDLKLNICSVGDISFQGRLSDFPTRKVFGPTAEIFKASDLVIGNLEGPLVKDGKAVAGKCVLRGDPGWATLLREVGFHVVSLANNHIMDYGVDGLVATMSSLKAAGLHCVGAGVNREEAEAPLVLEQNQVKVSIIARSSVIVSSPSYAAYRQPGVAFFDLERTADTIRQCARECGVVILILHWGLEEYLYPTPGQRKLAKALADAGADVIFGHHPHVVQGMESLGGALVSYSSGNFVFDEFEWEFSDSFGNSVRRAERLSNLNRLGEIVQVRIHDSRIQFYDALPTVFGQNREVAISCSDGDLQHLKRLSRRLQIRLYKQFWRLHSLRQEWRMRVKPILAGRTLWSVLRDLRPKHFGQLIDKIKRSARITSEKTTNPYE
jgi:hypothetical protein